MTEHYDKSLKDSESKSAGAEHRCWRKCRLEENEAMRKSSSGDTV